MSPRRVIFSMVLSSLFILPMAAWSQEEGASSDPPPPENWKPAGEVTPPAPSAAAEEESAIPSPMLSYGPFELDVHGRVQTMLGMVGEDANTDNGDILSRDGFRIRRARLGVDGRLYETWHYQIELDLIDEEDGGNALIDANIQWRPCEFGWVKAGVFKLGFSRTLMASSGQMQFMERPVWVNLERATGARMLDPGRQVGISAGGKASLFSYEVGVFNGSPGFSKGDLNDGLLYVVRLGVGMGEIGWAEADLARSDEFRWRFGINGYINHEAAAEYRGAGVDVSAKWYGASFHAEALWSKGIPNDASQDVVALLDETERWGMYAQAGYVLPVDFLDIELAVRFAMMDDQVHIDDEGDIWELTAGVNLYFYEQHIKLMLNYILREEMNGADLSNDMVAAMLQLAF